MSATFVCSHCKCVCQRNPRLKKQSYCSSPACQNARKRMRKYISCDLLIIDEMGHDRLELQAVKEAHLLFKVIDQRYNNSKSLIFTTNVEEPDWAEFLGDPITTAAILDRIFQNSVIVRINGPSYRMYQSELLQEKYAPKDQE